jgi:hypothetical protein
LGLGQLRASDFLFTRSWGNVKTIPRMGQFYWGPSYQPERSIPSAPVEPSASVPNEINQKTRDEILAVISTSKRKVQASSEWWASTPNAKEILGEKIEEYRRYLSQAMGYENLANTIEYRLSRPGPWLIHDWEIRDVTSFKSATDAMAALVDITSGDAIASQVEPGPRDMAITGGIALGAFLTAFFI